MNVVDTNTRSGSGAGLLEVCIALQNNRLQPTVQRCGCRIYRLEREHVDRNVDAHPRIDHGPSRYIIPSVSTPSYKRSAGLNIRVEIGRFIASVLYGKRPGSASVGGWHYCCRESHGRSRGSSPIGGQLPQDHGKSKEEEGYGTCARVSYEGGKGCIE